MTRNKMREIIMKLIYQADIHNEYMYDFFTSAYELMENKTPVNDQYFASVVKSFIECKTIIDKEISENLKKWDIDRIGKVELAIMRLAVTEMMYVEDIPMKVSINEAVEIAKVFADDNAPKYINGVLASVLTRIEND